MLKTAYNNMKKLYQMTKSPKISLIFKILINTLMKLMQKLYYLSVLWNIWCYSWDVRAKSIISKIEFERADIKSNFKG